MITVNRGEYSPIPFKVTDAIGLSLAGKRVTASFALRAAGDRVLHKISAMPGSTADVTISTQTPGEIDGFINLLPADFNTLTADSYAITVWTDSGVNDDRVGANDTLTITPTVGRS